MNKLLEIKNLEVLIEEKKVLNNINLDVKTGEIHAIMGPNGSGKTSLSYTIIGHPKYKVVGGKIFFEGQDITNLSVSQKAKKGIFLAFQYPYEIQGLTLRSFLRQAYNSLYSGTEKALNFDEFNQYLDKKALNLNINLDFLNRSLNYGFSGGEKKKAEILQFAVLEPKLAIFDEIDSGLDADALKTVCKNIKTVKDENPDMSIILITHYPRILGFLEPDFVHILKEGKIIKTGSKKLAIDIENEGYK